MGAARPGRQAGSGYREGITGARGISRRKAKPSFSTREKRTILIGDDGVSRLGNALARLVGRPAGGHRHGQHLEDPEGVDPGPLGPGPDAFVHVDDDQELLDGGSLEVDRTEFIFNTAVAGVINSLKEEIAEKRIAFRPPDPQHLAVVRADRPRLTRALGRIFAEAVRWTAEEGWLRVDIVQGEEAAEISFGFLLSPAFQGFEDLFSDGGGKAKDKEVPACRGTIGLSVARRIVELHGGRISARSEKDMEGYITLAFPMREPLRMEDKLEVEPSHEHGSDFRIIPV